MRYARWASDGARAGGVLYQPLGGRTAYLAASATVRQRRWPSYPDSGIGIDIENRRVANTATELAPSIIDSDERQISVRARPFRLLPDAGFLRQRERL